MIALEARVETWPIAGAFTLARGSRTQTDVITVALTDGVHRGWGEGAPLARYGETGASCVAAIEDLREALAGGVDRQALRRLMPHGAARNAVDCALWDLEAKRSGRPVWALAGLPRPSPVETVLTISLGAPEAMAVAAGTEASRPILKLKLGGAGDLERVRAVRAAAPATRLIVDANEAWTAEIYDATAPGLAELGVELIEQPFPAADDGLLVGRPRPVPVCADESLHDREDLPKLVGRYDFVNIKLDKTGGLTEAIELADAAAAAGLGIMVGCMVGTSLGMAPAQLLACRAKFVDIDGPLLLARDRKHGLLYEGSLAHPPTPALWG